jgi:hypothetical protein
MLIFITGGHYQSNNYINTIQVWVINMTNSPRDSLNPLLFGIVVALASVLVTPWFQSDIAPSYGTGGSGGRGGSGGLLVCPPVCPDADVDVAEAAGAGNATMMMTNQTSDGNTAGVEFLSIQTAQSGSVSQINATAYTLELNDIANKTIMFSDRPNRIVTSVSTADFVGKWTTGPNSFSSNEPNDALIVENTQTGNMETAIIELFDPVNDIATNSLTYTITTENATSIGLPEEFGQSVLVIDGHKVGDYPFHFPQKL